MKARTARVHYLVSFVLAFVGVAVFSAIVGLATVFPFAKDAIGKYVDEYMAKKAEDYEKRKPALKVAKEKKAALKKEQAKLKKDKKKLEKAKKKAMDKRVKRIYEERVANGYEASLEMIDSEAAKVEKAAKKPAKAKKAKKEKAAPVASVAPVTPAAPVVPVVSEDKKPAIAIETPAPKAKKEKKAKKAKKEKAPTTVVAPSRDKAPAIDLSVVGIASSSKETDTDYTANGSMFRGISF